MALPKDRNDREYQKFIERDDGQTAVAVDVEVSDKAAGGSLSAEYKSPEDFSATYTSSSTITLSGLPFTIHDSSQISYVKVITSSNTSTLYTAGAANISFSVSSNVLTIYESGTSITSLDSGDVYGIGINSQTKSYDPSTNSTMTSELNPEYAHYTSTEHIIDEADIAAGTYRVVVDIESYKNFGLHLKGSGGVTFTVWASLDDTADDTADTGWVDISSTILGAASLVDSEGIYFIDSQFVCDRLMIKYVTSDATNAVDAWIKKA